MKALIAALLLGLGSSSVLAGQFFASSSGNDANDCLSAATPCRTLAAVVAKLPIVKPDGTEAFNELVLLSGSNFHETLNVTHLIRLSVHGPLNPDGSWGASKGVQGQHSGERL